jgi:hypothetical protein
MNKMTTNAISGPLAGIKSPHMGGMLSKNKKACFFFFSVFHCAVLVFNWSVFIFARIIVI